MRIGIVTFPGSLDDRDAARAVRHAGGEAISLWHADDDLRRVDAVVLPGGFTYGDYLRAGAISAFAPIMERVAQGARGGMPVLGICNGFQILCEAHLLPGAMTRNEHRSFLCRDQPLRVENTRTAWTTQFSEGEVIRIPLKNGEGRFAADAETLREIEGEGRVVFRYAPGATAGPAGYEINPNGSVNDIAGVTNDYGNVVGLMPHPEHATESGFGPDDPAGGLRGGTDGLRFFTSVLTALAG